MRKFILVVSLMLSLCLGLTLLFDRLSLSIPWFLSAALLMSGVVADYRTTVVASRLGGKEANPLTGWLFGKVGIEKGGLIVMGIFAILIGLEWKSLLPCQQLAVGCTYLIVPINNFLVIRKRRR